MGGMGSGNRYRYDKKLTVEESLTLAMQNFNGRLYRAPSERWSAAGTLANQGHVGVADMRDDLDMPAHLPPDFTTAMGFFHELLMAA
jgi:hypothetical protein